MGDNFIEASLPIQEGLIEEQPSLRRDLWSRLKESPNRWVWFCLGIISIILPMSLPYIFFGSYFMLYLVGTGLVASVVLYLGFTSMSSYSKPSKMNRFLFFFAGMLTLCSLYHVLNYDRHVLVDYRERLTDFPYETITRDIANPQLGDTDSFTMLVKPTSFKFKGPDFSGLAGEVRSGSKEYLKGSLEEFKPFTIYYGLDAEGRTGDIKGKRIVNGWFGSTSTDFVIELEK